MGDNRGLAVAFGVLVLVALLAPMMGGGLMGPGMMGWWHGPSGNVPVGVSGWTWGLAMGVGMLGMLAFWGALVLGVGMLFRTLLGGAQGDGGKSAAMDVLRRRYAAGEITREQFDEMRRVIEER